MCSKPSRYVFQHVFSSTALCPARVNMAVAVERAYGRRKMHATRKSGRLSDSESVASFIASFIAIPKTVNFKMGK